jgi:hypothetical protein
MTDNSKPTGLPFSRLYLRPAEPQRDISERARVRLGAFVDGLTKEARDTLASALRQNLGLIVPRSVGHYWFGKFFNNAPTVDALDALTGIFRALMPRPVDPRFKGLIRPGGTHIAWLEQCRAVLAEESLGYRMDDEGGVHPVVDIEFEAARMATLRRLARPEYGNVLHCFEAAHGHFEARTPDYKAAVRSMFEALEGLLRQMTGTQAKLGRPAVRDNLTPLILSRVPRQDPTELRATEELLESFGSWANSLHAYRHGQGVPDPVAPSPEFSAFVLSSGASYLRWLLEFDQRQTATPRAGG